MKKFQIGRPKRGSRREIALAAAPFPHDEGEQQAAPTAEAVWRTLANASAVVGLHPDGATEAIVDFALATGKPFAVVPCCVRRQRPALAPCAPPLAPPPAASAAGRRARASTLRLRRCRLVRRRERTRDLRISTWAIEWLSKQEHEEVDAADAVRPEPGDEHQEDEGDDDGDE